MVVAGGVRALGRGRDVVVGGGPSCGDELPILVDVEALGEYYRVADDYVVVRIHVENLWAWVGVGGGRGGEPLNSSSCGRQLSGALKIHTTAKLLRILSVLSLDGFYVLFYHGYAKRCPLCDITLSVDPGGRTFAHAGSLDRQLPNRGPRTLPLHQRGRCSWIVPQL